MKYPPNMPKLEEPNFILAEPVWVQYLIKVCFLLFGLGAGCIAYYSVFLDSNKRIPIFLSVFFAAISFITISTLFRKNMWQRSVFFAADKKGCHFLCNWQFSRNKIFFMFIPWDKIGKTSIDTDYDSGTTVMLQLRVSDKEWEENLTIEAHTPDCVSFLKTKKDKQGYRNYSLGSYNGVLKTIAEIEKIRALSKVDNL